jgi:ABC-2 type transport system permease protein
MNAGALSVHQLGYEQKSYWRNPASAGFTFAFPVIFLVLFGSLNNDSTIDFLGGLSWNQYYIAGILCFGVISASFTNLAMTLSIRRDEGVLKRLHGTPLPASSMFGGLLLNALVVAAILTAILMAVAIAFFDVTFPGHWAALVVALVVGTASFAALGVAVASVIPNADAAPAIVNGVLFPILFISGVFFPIEGDAFLGQVGDVFPVRHFVNAVFAAFDPRLAHGMAHGWAWDDLAVVAIWGVIGAIVAVRFFRWDPRRK